MVDHRGVNFVVVYFWPLRALFYDQAGLVPLDLTSWSSFVLKTHLIRIALRSLGRLQVSSHVWFSSIVLIFFSRMAAIYCLRSGPLSALLVALRVIDRIGNYR